MPFGESYRGNRKHEYRNEGTTNLRTIRTCPIRHSHKLESWFLPYLVQGLFTLLATTVGFTPLPGDGPSESLALAEGRPEDQPLELVAEPPRLAAVCWIEPHTHTISPLDLIAGLVGLRGYPAGAVIAAEASSRVLLVGNTAAKAVLVSGERAVMDAEWQVDVLDHVTVIWTVQPPRVNVVATGQRWEHWEAAGIVWRCSIA